MLKYSFWILIILSFFCACSYTDNGNSRADKIQQVGDLHQQERELRYDSSFALLDQALAIINTIEDCPDSLLIENTFRRGFINLRVLIQPDSALKYLQKTIDMIPYQRGGVRIHVYFRNTWEAYYEDGKLKNSAAIAQQYIDKPADTHTDFGLYFAYNTLQRISIELNQMVEALFYTEQALKYAVASGEKYEYESQLLARADILFKQGGKDDIARAVYDSLLKDEDKLPLDLRRRLYLQVGFLASRVKDQQAAISNFQKAMVVVKEANSFYFNEDMSECYANLAESYKNLRQYDKAKRYLDSSLNYASKTARLDLMSFAAKEHFKIAYLKREELERSVSLFDDMIEWQNRIYNDRIKEELQALKASNEKEKALLATNQKVEVRNIELGRQRIILFTTVLISLLMAVIIALFYFQRKLRFEKKGLQMQQRLLRSQMNPHFTYNTLTAIQNLIKKDQEGASKYLVKFSRLLRLVLENSTLDYVELEKELESVKKYLELQLLRFPDRFSYQVHLIDIDEDDLLFIPPMLIQPFVENSIEHGFQGIDYKGEVEIILTKSGKYLHCVIRDNGIGFPKVKRDHKKSLSGKLISDFIEKATNKKVTIRDRFNESESTSGVEVVFSIPYKFTEYD